MDPIQEAIEEIELREADDDLGYRQIAKTIWCCTVNAAKTPSRSNAHPRAYSPRAQSSTRIRACTIYKRAYRTTYTPYESHDTKLYVVFSG